MKVFLFLITVVTVWSGCNSKNESPSSTEDSTSSTKESISSKNEISSANNEIPSAALQIKSALLAAPPEKRDSCAVYGYAADTQFTLLKKGTNELICVADDPKSPGFSAACYVRELDPFMQRGRELQAIGRTRAGARAGRARSGRAAGWRTT